MPIPWVRPEPTRETLSYLAGFLDGEGCIMLPSVKNRAVPSNRLAVVVDNTAEHALRLYADTFGGSVIRIAPSRSNQRGYFRWTVTDRRAQTVLVALLPFLRVKAAQARIALEFRATVQKTCRSPSAETQSLRADMVRRIRRLNARGTGVPLYAIGTGTL